MMGKKNGKNFINKRSLPIPGSRRSQRKAERTKIRSLNKQILQPIDWSLRKDLQPIVKNIYQEHVKSSIRLPTEVAEYSTKHQITINGATPNPILNFNESSFPNYFLTKINQLDYTKPTPLQAFCWPIALRGHNLLCIAKARTGSGKILAFLLPTILHVKSQPKLEADDGPIALILTPTRARAQEIQALADVFSSSASVRNACLMSGISKIKPSKQLIDKPEFIISTPDLVTDFYLKGELKLNRCTYVILDEADRLMTFGFAAQIKTIFGKIRPDRQVLVWSATWSKEISQLASELVIGDYVKVNKGPLEVCSNQNVTQHFHICNERRKGPKLKELLDYLYNSTANNPGKIIIFMASSNRVKRGVKFLEYYGRRSVGLCGAIKPGEREKTLKLFTLGEVNILIATDLVGREVEVGGVSYVINFDFPETVPKYVLRVAYAGRQSKRGTAYTFFTRANAPSAKELLTVLREANQAINPTLEGLIKEETYLKTKCRKAGGNGGNCGLNLGPKSKNMASDQKELKSGKRKQTLTESESEYSSAKRRDCRELEEDDDSDDSDDDVESDESESIEASGGIAMCGQVGNDYGSGPGLRTAYEACLRSGCDSDETTSRAKNHFDRGAGFINERRNEPACGVEFDNAKRFVENCDPRITDFNRNTDFRSNVRVKIVNERHCDEFMRDRSRSGSELRSDGGIGFANERSIDDFRSQKEFDFDNRDRFVERRSRERNEFRSHERFDYRDEAQLCSERRSQERRFFNERDAIRTEEEIGFRNDKNFVERRSAERAFFDFRDETRGIERFKFDNEEGNEWAESRNRDDYDAEHGFRTDGDAGFGNERDIGWLRGERISANSLEDAIDNSSPNDVTRSRDIDWIYRNEGRRNSDEIYRSSSPQGGFLHDERNDFSNNREDTIFDRDEHISHNQKTEPGYRYRVESPYRNRNENNLSYEQRHFRSRNEERRKRDTNFNTRRDEKFSGTLTNSSMRNDDGFPQRNARFRSPCRDDRLHEDTGFGRSNDDHIFTRRDRQKFDAYGRGFNDRNQRSGNNRRVSGNSYNRYN